MVSVQLVVAVCVMAPRLATGSSPDWNCAWSIISCRLNRSRQSSLTPGSACTAASLNTREVQSRQVRSFLGASIGGGPVGGLVVCGAPWAWAPESVAYRGLAAKPGAQPASKVESTTVEVPSTRTTRRRCMLTNVLMADLDALDVARVQISVVVGE